MGVHGDDFFGDYLTPAEASVVRYCCSTLRLALADGPDVVTVPARQASVMLKVIEHENDRRRCWPRDRSPEGRNGVRRRESPVRQLSLQLEHGPSRFPPSWSKPVNDND